MVLIGSATLREGIDISGGGFKAVILDQLPFEYHKDIILQSKAEQISENSAKSFIDFFLPRAVLYFKQAVGRLIRHEDDYGLWVVLDNRILNKNYGKYFLDVIYNVEIIEDIEKVEDAHILELPFFCMPASLLLKYLQADFWKRQNCSHKSV